jgi:asparagine synthase (glutamine-hydrolysing)
MCGIAGIVDRRRDPSAKRIVEEMIGVQRHRGPDDTGFYQNGNAYLGHARLSIIDLSSEAHQPMANEDSTLHIVHNGEIYNYEEITGELKRLGHCFRSRSDTEAILHAYEEWGEDCVRRFNGMWAFAILDMKRKVLFASRDRFGVKPFYYYANRDLFVFASEIKALLRHPAIKKAPNDHSIFNYLSSGYGYMDISDETFFEDIKQLKPSHSITLSLANNALYQRRYWNLESSGKDTISGDESVFGKFYYLFTDAVRLRLRSDVPLGVSLSGGLDSSSVSCIAAKLLGGKRLEAFSSCFDEKEFDERRFMKPVLDATGANANMVFARPDDLFTDMKTILFHQEEPYSTLSIFPQWYVMKLAKEKGVKVLLTGQGGDETLAGYDKYYYYLFADLLYSFKWPKAAKEMALYKKYKGDGKDISANVTKIILSHMLPDILKKGLRLLHNSHPEYLNRDFATTHLRGVATEKRFPGILNNDLYNALKVSPLPSLLHIDDRSSMAHSVESRSPFLDYRLVEYLFSLGPEYKIRDGLTKYILRSSMKGILPEEVRIRRDKMGFATPLERWFRSVLKDEVYEIINSREFAGRPYLDHKKALEKFSGFLRGEERCHYTIWSWVNLELWFRKFFDET